MKSTELLNGATEMRSMRFLQCSDDCQAQSIEYLYQVAEALAEDVAGFDKPVPAEAVLCENSGKNLQQEIDELRKELNTAVQLVGALASEVSALAAEIQNLKSTQVLGVKFNHQGDKAMGATLPAGDTLQGWVTDTVNGVSLASVPADDIIVAASSDTNDFTVTMDSPAVPNPNGPTVASFTITASSTPDQPNVAVNLTITASGDATLAAGSLTDTITVSTAPEAQVLGDLFGTPVVPASSAAKAAAQVKKPAVEPTAKKA